MTSAVLALLAGVGAAGTAAERGALWGKLNPYIECINSASPQVGHGARLYSGWVDVRKGPTGKEKVVNGVLALPASIVERCLRAMQAAEAKAPRRPELEQAGAAYAKALVEVQARTGEAYDYYHQGDYKDDRMARGKAMHPALMQAWERFHAADDGLRALVTSVADRLGEEDLAALEKSGPRLVYLVQKTMLEAKMLMRLVEGGPDAPAEKLSVAVDNVQASAAAVAAQLASDKVAGGNRAQADLFVTAAKDLVASAKELVRYRRSGKKYDSIFLENNPEMVDGHPAQVLQKYNDLVDRANWLRR